MVKSANDERFLQAEALVKAGQISLARLLIQKLFSTELDRANRLRLANLARRVGRIDLGLRILRPIIYPERGPKASEAERTEYAVLLSLNGNNLEAFGLLKNSSTPPALLAKAWCHFERWEYAEAVPLLEKYIQVQKDPYYLAAGWINLAEAYGGTAHWESSLNFLDQALAFTKDSTFMRLRANALHVRAQGLAAIGELSHSNRDLDEAEKLFGAGDTNDAFLIHRQRAINKSQAQHDPGPLRRFSQSAKRSGNWEAWREIDFQLLRISFNEKRFSRLYFGTPYPAYRTRLLNEFSCPAPEFYTWGKSKAPTLHLLNGELENQMQLKGQDLELIRCLSRDLYVPASIGKIFTELFPRESFSQLHSPNKIHQAVFRLRAKLAAAKVPIEIVNENGLFSIQLTGHICVEIRALPDFESPLSRLELQYGKTEFSASEARVLLGLPKTSLNRILKEGFETGRIEVRGKLKNTRYRFQQIRKNGG